MSAGEPENEKVPAIQRRLKDFFLDTKTRELQCQAQRFFILV
jgi:hypothetical protein